MTSQEDAEARLVDVIETGRVGKIGHFLLEHLADWGPGDLDVGRLARRVFERIDEDGEEPDNRHYDRTEE